MNKVAFIFPGQGAQFVGMGKDLYESSQKAKEVIDEVDSILGNGLKEVMFNGPEEKLQETAYAQPAIFAMSIAAQEALREKNPDISPAYVAGLSLGEYPALTACKALSLEACVKLIERRGAFMQEATLQEKGAMAAVVGLDVEKIAEICDSTGAEVANFNAPDQTVITGKADNVAAACDALTAAGAKRVIPLSVAGAFHSSLMQPAADKFSQVLNDVSFDTPVCPLVGNVNASALSNEAELREELKNQIVSSVQWVKTIEFMKNQGVTKFYEIGPGKVLKGLLRRIDRDLEVVNIGSVADLEVIVSDKW